MPVTTRPSPQLRGNFTKSTIHAGNEGVEVSPEDLRREVVKGMRRKVPSPWEKRPPQQPGFDDETPVEPALTQPIIATSIDKWTGEDHIILYGNGFIDGINDAFANDLDLVLRPDDVWLAIVAQFSLYVTGNAEELRHSFVRHEGKKELTVDCTPFSLDQLDLGRLAQEMTREIEKNVLDPEMKEWMIPSFSTTTELDQSVASFVMMGSMQKYFEYTSMCGCGFPSVTLLGEKSDWENIEARIQKLPKYGAEPSQWSQLLVVVIRVMIRTFDEPDSQEIKDFWLRVSHFHGLEASGTRTLSGWITAFAFWDEDGKRIQGTKPEQCYPVDSEQRKQLTLDSVEFPLLYFKSVPRGVVAVPITIADVGAGVKRRCTAMAGSAGMRLTGGKSKVQPFPAWCVIQEWEEPLRADVFATSGSTTNRGLSTGSDETF